MESLFKGYDYKSQTARKCGQSYSSLTATFYCWSSRSTVRRGWLTWLNFLENEGGKFKGGSGYLHSRQFISVVYIFSLESSKDDRFGKLSCNYQQRQWQIFHFAFSFKSVRECMAVKFKFIVLQIAVVPFPRQQWNKQQRKTAVVAALLSLFHYVRMKPVVYCP